MANIDFMHGAILEDEYILGLINSCKSLAGYENARAKPVLEALESVLKMRMEANAKTINDAFEIMEQAEG